MRYKKKVPVILQLSETECGIASLAMIFAYYGAHVSLEVLREKCGVSRDGCKAQTLINVAREYGFSANAYKVDIEDIINLNNPVIAYWNFNHYVVINRITMNKAYISDPAHGEINVRMEEFDRSFTGVIIDITPTRQVIEVKRKLILPQLIKHWLSGYANELLYLSICLVIIGSVPYLSSILSTIFIDQCLVAKNISWIPYVAIFLLISATIFIVTTVFQKIIQFKLYSKASILKSAELVAHVLQLPMLFYSLRQRSEIIAILTRAESAINLLFKNVLDVMAGFMTSIVCLVFMCKINLLLTYISTVMTLISVFIFYWLSNVNLSYEKSNINAFGKLYSHSISIIKNIETVKSSGLEDRILKKWHLLFHKKIMLQDKINVIGIMVQSLSRSCNSITTLSLLCLGSYQVSNGVMSIGNLMGYYSLYLIFYHSLTYIFKASKDIQSVYAMNARFNDIVMYEKDRRYASEQTVSIPQNSCDDIISISNLSFYYNVHSEPVLKNINIKIKQNEHIAFVGSTGSGKSTLAKLLCALYQLTHGDIKLFGKRIDDFIAADLAKACAYVSQDVSLFSGTIYQNLTLWKDEIDISSVNQAIKDACLNDLINERGLHGKVEEEGSNFSGGEKQRIDIARALIQNTPILILDEATSALDNQTEKVLINNLRNTNKTIIFVAHRLSTIQHCDQILVMQNGEIAEFGSHAELMNKRSDYYSLIVSEEHLTMQESRE